MKVTDTECLEMSREHIAYEVLMLNYCALKIDGSESLEQNLYVEGFALHLRNLIAFLYSTPKQDDVCAACFFSPGGWEKMRGIQPDVLLDAENRAHKQMAHITLSRLRKQRWEIRKIIEALMPVLQVFVTGARPELIHDDLRRQVEYLEKRSASAPMHYTLCSTTTTTTSFSSSPFPMSPKQR